MVAIRISGLKRAYLLLLDRGRYVTHSGLLKLAVERGCTGIEVSPEREFCDKAINRWTFKAVVYR